MLTEQMPLVALVERVLTEPTSGFELYMYACVPGEPVAKGRPRFSTFSGKPRPVVIKSGPRKGQVRMSTTRVQARTPKATKDWEKLAAHYFAESWRAIRGRKRAVLDNRYEVVVLVEAVFGRGKELLEDTRRGRAPAGRLPHSAKPDRDNLDKAVCDALQKAGVVADDSVISSGMVQKAYRDMQEEPGVRVRLYARRRT